MTWAASRYESHSSKWSFSDLLYFYDSNEDVEKYYEGIVVKVEH